MDAQNAFDSGPIGGGNHADAPAEQARLGDGANLVTERLGGDVVDNHEDVRQDSERRGWPPYGVFMIESLNVGFRIAMRPSKYIAQ